MGVWVRQPVRAMTGVCGGRGVGQTANASHDRWVCGWVCGWVGGSDSL